ncbi:MAG: 3'-5' exonuclease [bacterium]|nr:3'-5' exonuclease [bacterium]
MGLLSFFKRQNLSESLDFYHSMFPQRIDPIPEKNTFVVIDTETTGLDKEDDIVSIGAIQIVNGMINPVNIFEITLSTNKRSEESLAIHEVLGETINQGENIEENFLNFMQDNILVGHHVQFDLKMLENWIAIKYPGFKIRNKWIDTANLAKRMHKEELSRMIGGNHFLGLDNLMDLYDIPVENRHTALGDAYMTGLLFLKLVERLRKRGVNRTNDLI